MVNLSATFFRWHFVWVSVNMLQYKKIDVSEGVDDVNKQVHQKNACFAIIGTLKMLDLNHMFVASVVMYWWLLMS